MPVSKDLYSFDVANDFRTDGSKQFEYILVKSANDYLNNTIPSKTEGGNTEASIRTHFFPLKTGNTIKCAAANDIRSVLVNFVMKFQFPNFCGKGNDKFIACRKENINFAPMRTIISLLEELKNKNESQASLSYTEIVNYIYSNQEIIRNGNYDLSIIADEIILKRNQGIIEEIKSEVFDHWSESQWKRQLKDLLTFITKISAYHLETERIVANFFESEEERLDTNKILDYSSFFLGNTAEEYSSYMDIADDEMKDRNERMIANDISINEYTPTQLYQKLAEMYNQAGKPGIISFGLKYGEHIERLGLKGTQIAEETAKITNFPTSYHVEISLGYSVYKNLKANTFSIHYYEPKKSWDSWSVMELKGNADDKAKSIIDEIYKHDRLSRFNLKVSQNGNILGVFLNDKKLNIFHLSPSNLGTVTVFEDNYELLVDEKVVNGKLYKNEWILSDALNRYATIESLMNVVNVFYKGKYRVYIEDGKYFMAKNETKTQNRIIFGAPGTGKSFILNKEAKSFGDNVERVTFYPNYSYAQFVGTYKPFTKKTIDINGISSEEITYKFVEGPFIRVLTNALLSLQNTPQNQKPQNYLLIIEEINRANVASVFGDVFQLLDRDENGNSGYEIDLSEDLKKYFEDQNVTLCNNKLYIPSNMYIWATMNSADQGVQPMDAAFKRRWDFEYLEIDNKESIDAIKDIYIPIGNNKKVLWDDLRSAINRVLKSISGVNEDKLLGPFFLSKSVLDEYSKIENLKNIEKVEKFLALFKSKVLMYLYEDVCKMKPLELFKKEKLELDGYDRPQYSDICNGFNHNGIEIFKFKNAVEVKEINESSDDKVVNGGE